MLEVSLTITAILLVTLASGVWVALSLFATASMGLMLFKGNLPFDKLMGQATWNMLSSEGLIALPLFVLMAEILFHSRLSTSLFTGLAPWVRRFPGGLLHVNILACTMFAAVSGSSAATTTTVGRMTLRELFAQEYDRKLAIGSLAGAGTLGLLIPPSLLLIVYGVLSDTSILKLFLAGILPGLFLAGLYSTYIIIRCKLDPSLGAPPGPAMSFGQKLKSSLSLIPVLFLIAVIIVSMYGGYASPSEAAAVGVMGATIVTIFQGTLTKENTLAAILSTARTFSMVALILAGANFLSISFGFLGIPQWMATEVGALELSPSSLIIMLLLFYAVLGCFLDGLSAIVMTLPIVLPMVVDAGFDPIWFGIFLVVCTEMAQITPPVGFNLFVIQGLTGEKIGKVALAALPFFFLMVLFLFILMAVPEIALFLPQTIQFGG